MANLIDIIAKGSVNRSLTLRMADSTNGTPETGVTSATAGLDVWYHREGAAKVSLTESNLSALTDAHSDGGLLHISDGEYRVDFPDAAFATGANYVDVGWGATAMVGFGGRVRLTDFNLETAGSGARTVTVTVDDGTTALQNAKVRFTQGTETYIGTTDSSGNFTFNLDDATWTVGITKPGYSFTQTTLVVDANKTPTYSMTQIVTPTADPDQVTGFVTCYTELGVVEPGAKVFARITEVASSTGYAYDKTPAIAVADSNGVASFTGMFIGGTYQIWRGDPNARVTYTVTIPAGAADPYELVSVIGAP